MDQLSTSYVIDCVALQCEESGGGLTDGWTNRRMNEDGEKEKKRMS